MKSCIIVCIICALHLASADGRSDTILVKDVLEMSDREMREFLINRISWLEEDRLKHEKRIDDLEDTVLKQNEVIKSLQKALEGKDTTAELNDSNHEAPFHEKMKQDLKQEKAAKLVQPVRKAGRIRRQVSATPVAFSAILTHDLYHLGAHQDIVYDSTYVNTNDVYNPNHGVFTVPVSGVYVITATVMANQDREVWAEMVVNGVLKAYIYARGTDHRHDLGTQTILLHLKRGDDVAIRNYAADDSIYGGLYTTFSGFLLYEEGSLAIVG